MNKIKQLRQAANINQEELAKILNVQRATVSKYETGLLSLSEDVIIKMAEFFNVSTDYLLGKTDIVAAQEDASDDEFAWLDDLTADEIAEKCYEDFRILFSRSNKSTHEQMKGFYIDTYKRFNN